MAELYADPTTLSADTRRSYARRRRILPRRSRGDPGIPGALESVHVPWSRIGTGRSSVVRLAAARTGPFTELLMRTAALRRRSAGGVAVEAPRESMTVHKGCLSPTQNTFFDDKSAIGPPRRPAKAMAEFHAAAIAYATQGGARPVGAHCCRISFAVAGSAQSPRVRYRQSWSPALLFVTRLC